MMPFPFVIKLTILLSEGKLFKFIQVSNPDPLWAWSWRLYSKTFPFLSLYSSLFNFKQKSKAFSTQFSPSKAKVSFYISLFHVVLIYNDFPASLLNR